MVEPSSKLTGTFPSGMEPSLSYDLAGTSCMLEQIFYVTCQVSSQGIWQHKTFGATQFTDITVPGH